MANLSIIFEDLNETNKLGTNSNENHSPFFLDVSQFVCYRFFNVKDKNEITVTFNSVEYPIFQVEKLKVFDAYVEEVATELEELCKIIIEKEKQLFRYEIFDNFNYEDFEKKRYY